MKNKKNIILLLVGAITLIVVILGATYAYFTAQGDRSATTDVNVVTQTTDYLSFQVGDPINIIATQENFGVDDGDKSGTTFARAILTAGSSSSSATANYYVYLNITSNNFEYTTENNTAELILTISGPEGNVTTLGDLTYVTVGEVSGFDITTSTGLITIAENYSITAPPTEQAIQNWDITITFVNLDTDQNDNTNKSFSASLIIQEDALTFSEYIASLYTSDGVNDLYYHDADLASGAGDNSYRYSGANPNNYVCFGYNTTDDCSNVDYLYRIIGVFKVGEEYQVKLIKADYANSDLLGETGDYSTFTFAKSSYSTYKGNYTTVNSYYWNNTGDTTVEGSTTYYNMWSDSALNTVNLNGNFLTNIGTEWSSLIAFHNWKVGGMTVADGQDSNAQTAYNYEVGDNSSNTTYTAKIGLMYVSDYYYAAIPTYWTYPGYSSSGASYDYRAARDYNWMYMGLYEWTISRRSDYTSYAFYVLYTGVVGYDGVYYVECAVRPVFYLESSVEITGGSGTASDPYIISD